ncbi:hypothetical protein KMW28_14025 [Flammeovirga yaeyamensis]|uniref:Uncharacterized protein n=1 Tax=Flammeovirga yaeyamensis TaxID=367791 RepID=A0AAX1N4J6_9BACT|nr:hypothetical protein [Flammeovirga yaeyamensis]MBB3700297.1 hypothetical protein [Flammeovirga yaeyamensis]NMF37077.1 hypothetical protein [Flammeovirga yaeyamensis]QWG00768.1 hypothetical protein KMW28_14025 [Flammeovirga yaeyamensis]
MWQKQSKDHEEYNIKLNQSIKDMNKDMMLELSYILGIETKFWDKLDIKYLEDQTTKK